MKDSKPLRYSFYRALGYYPTHIADEKMLCDPYHIPFWKIVEKEIWEPHTFQIFSRFLNKDSIYYDIGAWIGPTVIYAARKCKKVVCFEPDPVAYQYLLWNIKLNNLTNVFPISIALADQDSLLEISIFGEDNWGGSTTSLLKTDSEGISGEVKDALALSWSSWLKLAYSKPEPNFLKIDIEGGEYTFLPTIVEYLREHKPVIYLSTHAPFLPKVQRKEKMNIIIEAMKIYDTCLNEKLEEVKISSLCANKALERFESFVFFDR